MSYKTRIVTGLYANAYGQVVITITQLAGVPILLHFWGSEIFGTWIVLLAISAYLSMADFGFGQSVANDMTQRVARDDLSGALEVFQTLILLITLTITFATAIWSIALLQSERLDLIPNQAMTPIQLKWVLWLLGLEVLCKLSEGVSQAGYRANGATPLHVSINYTTILLQHAAVWSSAVLGYGPLVAAIVFLAVRVISSVVVVVILKRRHPWVQFGISHARLMSLRTLVKPALANLGFPLAQLMSVQGMVVVIGGLLGPLAVVTFSTIRTLSRVVLQAIVSISHAAEPEFATAYGARNKALLGRLYVQAARAGLWAGVVSAAALLIVGDWLFALWTRGQAPMNWFLFQCLLGTALAASFWYSGLVLLKASNLHLIAAYLYAAATVGAVGLSYVLMKVTGQINVAGLLLLLVDAAMALFIVRATATLCEIAPLRILKALLDPRPLAMLLRKKKHAV